MFQSNLVQGIMHSNQSLGFATHQLTRIKIRGISIEEPISVAIKEDGIVTECNHAGTHQETYYFNEGFEDEYSRLVQVCDRGDAWSYDGQDWNEL